MLAPFLIFYLLCVHFAGDFLLQTDWMARQKSSELKALLLHVGAYTSMLVSAAVGIGLAEWAMPSALVAWVAVNSALHLATDFCTSRASKAASESGDNRKFWLVIGVDQLLHHTALLLSAALMLGG